MCENFEPVGGVEGREAHTYAISRPCYTDPV